MILTVRELRGGRPLSLLVIEDLGPLRALSNPIRFSILKSLAHSPSYAKELSERMGLSEQLIYYHLSKLREQGLIEEVGEVKRRGGKAVLYSLNVDGYAVLFRKGISEGGGLYLPSFVRKVLEGDRVLLVLSSPEPHGPFRSRGRDHYMAAELAYKLGALTGDPFKIRVTLDTLIKEEELSENLIIFGGPAVNVITAKINDILPVYFDVAKDNILISRVTGRAYHEDECGVIEVVPNPFNKDKWILLIAGKRLSGTRAALMALLKKGKALEGKIAGNGLARVVEGVDEDGDGIIDDALILE
ncbi:MAG: hypothetical protein B6U69_00745 [Thermofilum sp. ex4484_15]|nr:MAG: hypothetical protein B6U69_00745 [Thermofilum sp. ex4484_15]